MNAEDIKAAVDSGKTVHWMNTGYTVIKDSNGKYLISHCQGSHIGLMTNYGALNGEEYKFFLAEETYPSPAGIEYLESGKFPDSYCRKCSEKNHVVFFAPVFVAGIDARDSKKHPIGIGTHICFDCAESHGWIDHRTGDLKNGIAL